MNDIDPELQSKLECFWKEFENGFEIKEKKEKKIRKIKVFLKVVKFILENLMELTIFIKWESIFETILELDLNLAWNWKIRKRKGIGKCKNLKSYFQKTYPILVHLCLN